MNSDGQPVRIPRTERPETPRPATREGDEEAADHDLKSPDEKSPRGRKVKSWFKSHFSKGSKSQDEQKSENRAGRQGFIGGASLTGVDSNESSASLENRSASVRAVAMAGRSSQDDRRTGSGERPSSAGAVARDISPLSSSSSDDEFFDDPRSSVQGGLSPPRPIRDLSLTKSQSPTRDSRFHEII